MKARIMTAILLLLPAIVLAQVPVDDNGNAVGQQSQTDIMQVGGDSNASLSQAELQELVGPIALYPDDLLAIVLPAAAYPLQIVAAARFLEALKDDSSLQPDPDWDDTVVALTNYPEVIDLLNQDLDWTLRLGEAVIAQQGDVVRAVESFRDRAYAAGNLKSDSYQTVSQNDGAINISPVADDVIYVPYYEPTSVVRYQPRSVYFYYPQPHPVYYYPYSAGHAFSHGYFWGVTTAFTIGWGADRLNVYHHSYRGHPYYGRSYLDHGYRSPSLFSYNARYSHDNRSVHRYSSGDHWRARDHQRSYVRREGHGRSNRRAATHNSARNGHSETIRFRSRDAHATQGRVTRTRSEGHGNRQETTVRSTNSQRTVRQRQTREQAPAREQQHRQSESRNITDNSGHNEPIRFRSRVARVAPRDQAVQTRSGGNHGARHNVVRTSSTTQRRQSSRSRDTHRQEPAVRSRNTQHTTQRRVTRPQESVVRSSGSNHRRQQTPAPQKARQTESSHREQPSRQQKSEHGSRSKSRSSGTRSRHRTSRNHKR